MHHSATTQAAVRQSAPAPVIPQIVAPQALDTPPVKRSAGGFYGAGAGSGVLSSSDSASQRSTFLGY